MITYVGMDDVFNLYSIYILYYALHIGDYRAALQSDQPRLYEDIQDYDAAKGLFDEVHYINTML